VFLEAGCLQFLDHILRRVVVPAVLTGLSGGAVLSCETMGKDNDDTTDESVSIDPKLCSDDHRLVDISGFVTTNVSDI
jgi:hypothetical protein